MRFTRLVHPLLLAILLISTLAVCGLAGFIGASIGREQRDRGFFDAGWEGGKKWQREQPCATPSTSAGEGE